MLTVFKVFIVLVFAFLVAEGHWGYEKTDAEVPWRAVRDHLLTELNVANSHKHGVCETALCFYLCFFELLVHPLLQ